MAITSDRRSYLADVFKNSGLILFAGYVVGFTVSETFAPGKWYIAAGGFILSMVAVYGGYLLTERME